MGVSPIGAADQPPMARPHSGTTVRTAHEARQRGGGHAAACPPVLDSISYPPYTPESPIQFPIRIGTGFPFKNAAHIPDFQRQSKNLMPITSGLRRAGAAALDLADVARGRFEAF